MASATSGTISRRTRRVRTKRGGPRACTSGRADEGGEGRPYDCILGLSGGVDTRTWRTSRRSRGSRHCVHFDNGWNNEQAVHNIEQTLRRLDIDLSTNVLDWEEFRDLQKSFLRAGIANAEIPTYHSIVANLLVRPWQHKIKYVVTGSNLVTEAVLPDSWMHDAYDLRLIKSVQRRFGSVKLRTFPTEDTRLGLMLGVQGYKFVNLLNFEPYVKSDVKEVLAKELGWRDYGGKHYESVYTKFFQGWILPEKFGIDKRIADYSNLILAGQMSSCRGPRVVAGTVVSPGGRQARRGVRDQEARVQRGRVRDDHGCFAVVCHRLPERCVGQADVRLLRPVRSSPSDPVRR